MEELKTNKVKDDNYIMIQGWMVNELKLKGNDLMVYAIIYGFSQTEGQEYSAGLQYLADWCNSTKRGIEKNLKSLVEKGYIKKHIKFINGVKFVNYRYVPLDKIKVEKLAKEQLEVEKVTSLKVEQNLNGGMEQSSTGGMEQSSTGVWNKVPLGMEQSSTNNKDNNMIYNMLDRLYNTELKNFFKNAGVYADEKIIYTLPDYTLQQVYLFQNVLLEIYKTPTYKKYLSSIKYDDLISAWEKTENANNVKNEIAYMKKIILEQKRKEQTA